MKPFRLFLLVVSLLVPALAPAQSLTQALVPERVLDTNVLFGFPLSIVAVVEADGWVVSEEFLLRDDIREGASNLYYVISLRPDGTAWCSPGAHPDVALSPPFRQALTVRPIQGIHRLFKAEAKGVEAQYPLPFVSYRCY